MVQENWSYSNHSVYGFNQKGIKEGFLLGINNRMSKYVSLTGLEANFKATERRIWPENMSVAAPVIKEELTPN